MMKFKNISLSLSLSLSTCQSVDHFDFPERISMYQSLSLSFSLHLHLQKRFGSRSDPNGIQERMFRQLKKNVFMCDRKYAKCRTKADANDQVYIIRSHGEFLIITGTDPLKLSKLPSQYSTLGHHQHASKTPFKGASLAGR